MRIATLMSIVMIASTPLCANQVSPGGVSGNDLCQHLADIGCPQPEGCARAWDVNGELTTIDPKALLNAHTSDEASKLGVSCERKPSQKQANSTLIDFQDASATHTASDAKTD